MSDIHKQKAELARKFFKPVPLSEAEQMPDPEFLDPLPAPQEPPVLSAEQIATVKRRYAVNVAPIGSGRTVLRDAELAALCDSHEQLRARLALAERAREETEALRDSAHKAMQVASNAAHLEWTRAEKAEAQRDEANANCDAACEQRDAMMIERDTLRTVLEEISALNQTDVADEVFIDTTVEIVELALGQRTEAT